MKTKDCPFCGARDWMEGHKIMQDVRGDDVKVYCECTRCGARGPILAVKADAPAELKIMRAGIAWNVRNGLADVNARRQLAALAWIRDREQIGRSALARMRRVQEGSDE